LAVEEQFYVLFPLFLVLFWKLGKRWIIVTLALVFVASLAASQWAAFAKPAAAFYLLPTRGWELLIGAFAAFYLSQANRKEFGKGLSELGGWLGVALIFYSVFAYSKSTPFPGYYALVPTLGTVFIILFATQQTIVGKFVGNKAFVGVGLISYSAYLWHQPLFAFARHKSFPESIHIATLIILSVLTLVLAYFSWRYVEAPFRNKTVFKRKFIFLSSLFFSLIFIVFGLIGHLNDGYKSRFSNFVFLLENPNKDFSEICNSTDDKNPCVLGAQKTIPKIAILGDSHSVVLRSELSKFLEIKRKSILSFASPWCAPLIGFGTSHAQKGPECREFMSESFRKVIENKDIDTVILVAQWSNYTKGYRWNDPGVAYYSDFLSTSLSIEENLHAFDRSLLRTLRQLRESGKKVLIVKSVPEYSINLPKILAKNYILSGDLRLGAYEIDRKKYADRNSEVEEIFSKINFPNVLFIDTFNFFCKDGVCDFADHLGTYYTDGNHLSVLGTRKLVPVIIDALGIE
jgi:hypothetical protein